MLVTVSGLCQIIITVINIMNYVDIHAYFQLSLNGPHLNGLLSDTKAPSLCPSQGFNNVGIF